MVTNMTSTEEVHNYEYEQTSQTDPYNTNVLETVQSATVGSAAVKYTTEPSVPEEEEPVTKSEELCRDFLQGRCGREGCKYKHDSTARETDPVKSPVCKDYQNSVCHRTHCKYLHLTKAEAEEFDKTGIMPEKKSDEKSQSGPEQCRDFLKGMCTRGNMCKYAHQITEIGNGSTFGLQGKRPYSALSGQLNIPGGTPQQVNDELKQKLLELRKQVLELSQLNDALYSENQKFRKQLTGERSVMGEKMSLLPSPYNSKNGYGY